MDISLRLAHYIARYAPSYRRITAYLQKKKCNNIEKILTDIVYDEKLMLSLWMRSYITLGVSISQIRFKLQKKEFPKDMIESILGEYHEQLRDWNAHESHIFQKIDILLSRGKSKRAIIYELQRIYPYFSGQIQERVSTFSEVQNLKKEVQKYKNKYNLNDSGQKQKFYTALMRKGFTYSDIQTAVRE